MRLTLLLALTGAVAAAQVPQELPLEPFTSFYTHEIFADIPELNPGDPNARFISTTGFTLARTHVIAIATSPEVPAEEPDPLTALDPRRNQDEEEVDVAYYTVGPEMWFLGHPANNAFEMQLVGISLSSREIVHGPYNLPGNAADPRSRLAMVQSVSTAPPVSGEPLVVGRDDRHIIVTNPRSHRVTGFLLDPDQQAGTQLVSAFQFEAADYDAMALPGDSLSARALGDVAPRAPESQPAPPEIDPLTEATYYFQVYDYAPTHIMGVDREHQPDPDLFNGRADPAMPALLSVLAVGPPTERIDSWNLSQTIPPPASYASPESEAKAFPFPSGVALETDALSRYGYLIARTGGFRDAIFVLSMDELGELVTEEILNSAHFNPHYPIRLSEIEFDIDGTMWVRTEVVFDEDGEQVYPDLFHISATFPRLTLPNFYFNATDPPNLVGRGDLNRDALIDSADIAWLVNYLNLGADPNFDPGLINRVDVDANGRYDFFDFEGLVTQVLVGDPHLDPPLRSIPAISLNLLEDDAHILPASTVWDIEVGDINHDGFPETFVLFEDAIGTSLYYVPGTGEIPSSPERAQTFALDFPARDMVLEDFTADGRPDLAMVTANVGSTAYLHLGFTLSVNASLEVALAFTPGFEVGPNPLDITTGDFDTDSRPDILIGLDRTSDNLVVFANRPGQSLERNLFTYGQAPRGLATGDLVRRGGQGDLVVAADDDFTVELVSITRAGVRQVTSTRDTSNPPRDVVIGRFATPETTYSPLAADLYHPNDNLDVAVIESPAVTGPALQIFRGDGEGGLSLAADIEIFSVQTAIDGEIADFNRDGRDDIMVVGRKAIAIYGGNPLLQSISNISFLGLAPVLHPSIGDITDAEVADFDRDGYTDAVIATSGTLFTSRLIWAENQLEPTWPSDD
jgi:FG-GAP-like repeat/Dockerin type I domain